jgi:uncharacterized linocin/CFP29 family protein
MPFDGITGGQTHGGVKLDLLTNVGAFGSTGKKLLASGFDVNCLRPAADGPANPQDPSLSVNGRFGDGQLLNVNATLMRDEWKFFDNTVQQVARERLIVTQFLMGRGLTFDLPNALGVMNIEWQLVKGDLVDAEVTMSGLTEATKDQLEFGTANMPVPIFHKEFYYDLRHLEAARRNGRRVDTEHATVATRKVSELIESVVFNGLTIAGVHIPGLRTLPNRITAAVTANWSTVATGEQMVSDTIRFIETLQAPPNNMDGPFIMLVSRATGARMGEDYKANSDLTIRQRLMEIDGLAGIMSTSRLSGSNILLVQLTSDVIQIINGLEPTLVEWDSHGGFQQNFKIIAIMLPRVRSNGWDQSGILHAS